MQFSVSLFCLLFSFSFATALGITDVDVEIPVVRLHNGVHLPLVGVGVGNLAHELIRDVVGSALQSDCRLIDTARASRNDHLVAEAIESGMNDVAHPIVAGTHLIGRTSKGDTHLPVDAVHVVTKVWYTHLGYDRTVLSVLESLSDLAATASGSTIKIRVHVLLHWSRCHDNISWTDCEGEEEALPAYVKEAGPPPHLNKETSWKESWKALEDLYTKHHDNGERVSIESIGVSNFNLTEMQELLGILEALEDLYTKHHDNGERVSIESIGVSNFNLTDMQELLHISRIMPHVMQGNVWDVVHDPHLMNFLEENNIVFQAFNVMNGVIAQKRKAFNAFLLLIRICEELEQTMQEGTTVLPSMLVLAWLVQRDISIIPRASSSDHQMDNSNSAIMSVPILSEEQQNRIESAVSALLLGEDLPSEDPHDSVLVTFVNALTHGSIDIFWSAPDTGVESPVLEEVSPGESFELNTHPGHVFVAYDQERKVRRQFLIEADYGGHEHFSVEL
eukprot:CAMPEP_0198302926 /NCGR_PEP_ID=MMETSP1449-20131203/56624_1 /TAXON_ID=420275 /ORGANISM="Attheya septentrionalis, Strain CCMP2084" /LENGTH=504 /DNA_ID=CAMNT_0044005405 /DNA_START=193 /DNA_END=1708 /DNA_ORIENTATION=+